MLSMAASAPAAFKIISGLEVLDSDACAANTGAAEAAGMVLHRELLRENNDADGCALAASCYRQNSPRSMRKSQR